MLWIKRKAHQQNMIKINFCDLPSTYLKLNRYRDIKTNNIAVLSSDELFNNIIKAYKAKLKPDDKIYLITKDWYKFILDEIEINIIRLRELSDFELYDIKYNRYE